MKIVEFTIDFSVRKAGEKKAYEDAYAEWLINDMKVAKLADKPTEPEREPMTKLPAKEAKQIPTTKEEKQPAKRQTKNVKN